MPILNIADLTYSELNRMDPSRCFVLASFSPIEVHGPHLPLGEDIFTAEVLGKMTADKIIAQHADWNLLFLPPTMVAADAVPRLGTVTFPPHMVRDVAYHTMLPFARAGFARLGFSSFHGGPRHFLALEVAAHRLSALPGPSAAMSLFSAALGRMKEGRLFFEAVENDAGFDLTLDQMREDHHAGFVETSLALHLWPELVGDGWEDLPASVGKPLEGGQDSDSFLFDRGATSLWDRVRNGADTAASMARSIAHFKKSTYYGRPHAASARRGKKLLHALTEIAGELAVEFIEQGAAMDVHSPLWRARHLLLNKTVNEAFDRWLNSSPASPEEEQA
ncbi:MAG: creatininase family protein [Candidatus Lernaella stagnicola]|nr:creatininase family protein [Candidatus Lernaella stagnicola]